MRVRVVAAIAVCLGSACADELELEPDPDPAEFAEVCGATEPVRILAFEPWRDVEWARERDVIGDRRLISVYYTDSAIGGSSLWSVGLCGESPRRLITERFFSYWRLDPYELPFACDQETGEIRVVDPTGERPPRVAFELPEPTCTVERTDLGLVYIRSDGLESESGWLELLAWPDDPWTDTVEPQILLDGVKTFRATPEHSEWDMVQVDGDDLFLVTVDDELVRYSLADASVEVVATGVLTFEMSWEPSASEADGWARRYLLWQSSDASNDDPEAPEGEVVLFDRVTSEQTSLGHAWIRGYRKRPLAWTGNGFVLLPLRVDGAVVLRLFRLPSFDYVDLPWTFEYDAFLRDDRLLVARRLPDEVLGLFDIETGEWTPVPGEVPATVWWDQGVLALYQDRQANGDSELWLWSGVAEPELVARRASYQHMQLLDGRLLTQIDADTEGIGDLLVVDPDTLEERLIEREVMANTITAPHAEGDPDTISYTVPEGDHAGVWLTRLQPPD